MASFLIAQAQAPDLWTRFRPDDFLGLVAIVGGLLLAAIFVIAICWRRVRLAELDAALKQQMLEKGMSAAEIAQVLLSPVPAAEAQAPRRANDIAAIKTGLVENLLEQSMPAEDIEQVLQALQEYPEGIVQEAAMVENMVEQGLSGGDIVRLLRAMRRPAERDGDASAPKSPAMPQARV